MRKEKVVKNVISSVLVQALSIICGFIVPRLIIRTYGSNINGLVSSITQFLTFITLIEAGFAPVIKSILFKPIANKDKDTIAKILKASEKIFRTIAYIFIAYIIVLCLVLPIFLVKQFDCFFTISLIIIIAISTFSEYYFGMTYKMFIQAEQKTYVVSVIQIITLLLNTMVIVVLIYFNVNIQIVKLASSLMFVLRPVLQNMYVKKKYNINLKGVSGDYKINQKWNGLIQHIAFVVHSNTDIIILTLFGNFKVISVYSVYLMVIDGIKSVVKSFVRGIDATFGDMIAKNETENLNRTFGLYEMIYFTLTTIVFSATLFLILPFVKLYTKGVTDVNYIIPSFAYLMVIAELAYMVRQPYNDLIKVAGHFKQTQIGAFVEAISNIVISIVLVWKFGVVGVAIGTLFAMVIRTIEFICYTSKNILHRSVLYALKILGAIIVEMIIISIIMNFVQLLEVYSYGEWMLNGVCVVGVCSVVVLIINLVFYKDSLKFARQQIIKLFETRRQA